MRTLREMGEGLDSDIEIVQDPLAESGEGLEPISDPSE